MHDAAWRAAYEAVRPVLRDSDAVLAPAGDWPAFPCVARFYGDDIEIGDATIVVLHKGRLAGADRTDLEALTTGWSLA